MTEKYILINETLDETRVCLIVDGSIEEFFVDFHSRDQIRGNLYCGVVVQVQPSLNAAFVDFGDKRNGFLAFSDLNYNTYPPINADKGRTIQNHLKPGQKVLVQVTREASENKGAALTTFFSFPGRYMVFMPNKGQGGGISKRIEDSDHRSRLRDFLSSIQSEDHSVIIRTAGVDRSIVELKKDYTQLERLWNSINRDFEGSDEPRLLMEEQGVVVRTIRDYYTDDINAIWTDNPETYRVALDFMKKNIPRRQKDLKLFVDNKTLFLHFGVERQVEQLSNRKVNLKSGGYLIIDQTEALVAVDVNSGRSRQESNTKSTALRTNLEAAEEVARQLRIRNMGGLVVVDFIDMDLPEDNAAVEKVITQAMEGDKANHSIGKISQFGLLELSRQRLSEDYARIITNPCPTCDGRGSFPSIISSSNSILRKIRDAAADGSVEGVNASLPIGVSNYLLNEKREEVFDLENEFGIFIHLEADSTKMVIGANSLKFTLKKEAQDTDKEPSRKRRVERRGKAAELENSGKQAAAKKKPQQHKSAKREDEETSKADEQVLSETESTTEAQSKKEVRSKNEKAPESLESPEAKVPESKVLESKAAKKAPRQKSAHSAPKPQGTREPQDEQPKIESPAGMAENGLYANFLFSESAPLMPEEESAYIDRFYGRLRGRKSEESMVIPSAYCFDISPQPEGNSPEAGKEQKERTAKAKRTKQEEPTAEAAPALEAEQTTASSTTPKKKAAAKKTTAKKASTKKNPAAEGDTSPESIEGKEGAEQKDAPSAEQAKTSTKSTTNTKSTTKRATAKKTTRPKAKTAKSAELAPEGSPAVSEDWSDTAESSSAAEVAKTTKGTAKKTSAASGTKAAAKVSTQKKAATPKSKKAEPTKTPVPQ